MITKAEENEKPTPNNNAHVDDATGPSLDDPVGIEGVKERAGGE